MVWELFKYETYKIIHSRLTIIVLSLMVILSVIMGLPLGQSKQTKDVHREMESMNGQLFDNTLMKEMTEAIGDRADPDWNPNTWRYVGFESMASAVLPTTDSDYTADDFYRIREQNLKKGMTESFLTEKEMLWWKGKEKKAETPFTFTAAYNARTLADYMGNIVLLVLLLAAICLSTVFASEHRSGMDQLILSARHGRTKTFAAKMLAGFVFILIWTAICAALLALTIYLNNGLGGLKAIVQMEVPNSAYPMTFLQFYGIQLLILFSAAVLYAAIAMTFSELMRNGVAVMGLMIGIYIAIFIIDVPKSYRVISQSIAMLPTELINLWSLMDHRLINIFGNYYSMFTVSPVICLVLTVILSIIARQAYLRYQIGGK